LRAQLGEDAFATAQAEGRTMTLEYLLATENIPTAALMTSSPQEPFQPLVRALPDELTAREVEVLRLLAQGLTDAQIAKQLVISPRTVNFHLKKREGIS
jgi:DNA-binding NarL/FixJ family response regulator